MLAPERCRVACCVLVAAFWAVGSFAALGWAAVGRGGTLPRVTLPDWDGRPLHLGGQRGKVVVVDFWATWCSTCTRALPALDVIARRHAGRGLVVLAINIDADRAEADRFLAERLPDPALTLLHDPQGEVMSRFGAAGMPALFITDRTGRVVLAEAGYSPARIESVERLIEGLLREAE